MPRRPRQLSFVARPTAEQAAFIHRFIRNPKLTVNNWAVRAGHPESTLRRFLTTEGATMNYGTMKDFATAEGITVDDLLTIKGKVMVPLVGKIGAGAVVHLLDGDSSQGFAGEQVELPVGVEAHSDIQALEIDGDSMHPLQNRWLIFYRLAHDGVTDAEIDKLCVVKLADGTLMLKVLHRGTTHGRFNLESWNAPLLIDQNVTCASPVLSIVPR